MMPDYTKNQYNALIHAIWRLDEEMKEPALSTVYRAKLQLERQALQEVFIGQFQIRGA